MARGKYSPKPTARRSMKPMVLILVLMLLLGGVIGGTVAWLIANTDPVVNTFTYGDINIELDETDTNDGDNNPNTNEYEMIPGQTITKDPVITVKEGSEAMWLFVKLDKSVDPDFDDFMTYTMAGGWTALSGVDGVYYREVSETEVEADDKEFGVIMNHTITVKEDVTKTQLNSLVSYPTLTVTAYAVQRAGIDTVAQAWAKASTANTNSNP